jgi:hypothetical protein
MDKWDEIVHRIQQGVLAEEPEAALTAALQLFAEFGRTLEMISGDMDRIATVMEHGVTEISGDPVAAPPTLDL